MEIQLILEQDVNLQKLHLTNAKITTIVQHHWFVRPISMELNSVTTHVSALVVPQQTNSALPKVVIHNANVWRVTLEIQKHPSVSSLCSPIVLAITIVLPVKLANPTDLAS